MTMRGIPRFALAVIIGLTALAPVTLRHALAHPLGNFTTNRYARIELYADRVRLQYVVDMAEIPAFQELSGIDADGDGAYSEAELGAYAEKAARGYAGRFELTFDGESMAVAPAASEARVAPGQGGLQTLRVAVVYEAPVTARGTGDLGFRDGNFRSTQGWKEIVVLPSAGSRVEVDATLLIDRSQALTNYPTESLKSAPNVNEARLRWEAGTGQPAPGATALSAPAERTGAGGFSSLFERLADGDVSLSFLLLSLAVAFAFGAQHALGPGHGKTMVAAYLVGSRGTPKHAVALGLTVTATHTSTVYLLGVVTLVAAAWLSPESVYLWMGVAAGMMVALFGAGLVVQRTLQYRRGRIHDPRFTIHDSAGQRHRHGLFGRAHSHGEPAFAIHDPRLTIHDSAGQSHRHGLFGRAHSHGESGLAAHDSRFTTHDSAGQRHRHGLFGRAHSHGESGLAIHDSQFTTHDSAGQRHRHGLFGRAHSHGESGLAIHDSRFTIHDSAGQSHRHGLFGRAHSHTHPDHGAPLQAPVLPSSRVTWRSLLSLGVLGGLLPCPSAVVVMVAAISQGQVLLGMLLIVAFSLGLAGVLMAIGVSLVVGRRFAPARRGWLSHPLARHAFAALPVVSAVVVTLVGLGLTYQAVARV